MSKLKLQNSNLSSLDLFTMTQVAYKVKHSSQKFDSLLRRELEGTDYEVLVKSTDSQEMADRNLRSVAYVNPETKEVVIAVAGTNSSSLTDIADDMQLVLGEVPSKVAPMKAFVAEVLNQLDNPQDYTFNVTGHSLGATVGQLTALHLIAQGQKVANCTTFDSPGAKKAFAHAVKEGLMENVSDDQIAQTKFTAIQSRPNTVNTLDESYGEKYVIILPKAKAAEAKTDVKSENIGYLAYIQNLVAQVGKAAVESFVGTSCYLVKLLSDHDYRMDQAAKISTIYKAFKAEITKKNQDLVEIKKTAIEFFEASKDFLSGLATLTKVAIICSTVVFPAAGAVSGAAIGADLATEAMTSALTKITANGIEDLLKQIGTEAASALIKTIEDGKLKEVASEVATSFAKNGIADTLNKYGHATVAELVSKNVENILLQTGSGVIKQVINVAGEFASQVAELPFELVDGIEHTANDGYNSVALGVKLFGQVSSLLQELSRDAELASVSHEHLLSAGWKESLQDDHIFKVNSGYNFKTDRSVVVEVSKEELDEMKKFQADNGKNVQTRESFALSAYNTIKKLFGFYSAHEIKFECDGQTVAFKTLDNLKDFLSYAKLEVTDRVLEAIEETSSKNVAEGGVVEAVIATGKELVSEVKQASGEVIKTLSDAASVAFDLQCDNAECSPMLEKTVAYEVRELSGEFLNHEIIAQNSAAAAA